MRINTYVVVMRAIEQGIERGIRIAHKHVEHPTHEQLQIAISDAVALELVEVVDFGSQPLPSIGGDVPGGGAW